MQLDAGASVMASLHSWLLAVEGPETRLDVRSAESGDTSKAHDDEFSVWPRTVGCELERKKSARRSSA